MKLLVTGGLGFIGSAVVRHFVAQTGFTVLNLDNMTYAANAASLLGAENSADYSFARQDICELEAVRRLFAEFKPDAVIHLAAESHVDRSIDAPGEFIQTNLIGTYAMLQAALEHWSNLDDRDSFRFLHVSTDEVFGSLGDTGKFTESTPYQPNSPYSASKAGADHLVRAWHHTYGLPSIISNCSNNYGPCQFPEKLIPLMILKGLEGAPLPVYGNGKNVRDWLYVHDHVSALEQILIKGTPGQTYNIGGNCEQQNIEIVRSICTILDEKVPGSQPHAKLISFVEDRPGHDYRYAIDASKMATELGWQPAETFSSGLEKTVDWYLDNRDWWQSIRDGSYQLDRLGKSR